MNLTSVSDLLQESAGRVRYRLGSPPWPAPIFVVGTGRSGTNWVGEILDSHPDIAASMERPRFFRLSTNMALNPTTRADGFPRLVRLYRYEIARVAPRHFADKSHPNIWIAELLAAEFPDAVFVGVHRSVYGTTASMLKHGGVMKWSENWRRYPVPNRFLGIDEGDEDWYDSLGAAGRSALRWVAHERRFSELRPVLGSHLVEVQYEELHRSPAEQLTELQHAVGLQEPMPPPHVNESSLDRWRAELTPEQIAEIDSVVAAKLPGPANVPTAPAAVQSRAD